LVRPPVPGGGEHVVQTDEQGSGQKRSGQRSEKSESLEPLGLLACAIANRALRVTAGPPGRPPWTDGNVIFVDPDADARRQVETIVVQASLLAAGSLAPDVVRGLRRRPALSRRYLTLEGHRALAAIADLLPPSVRPLMDPDIAARADTPADSLALARSREKIADPPASFGAIRTRRLVDSIEPDQPGRSELPDTLRTPDDPLAEFEQGEAEADGSATDGFASPDGSGGSIGRLLGRLLSVVREIGGGPPAGAATPMRRARGPMPGRGTPLSIRTAVRAEDTPFARSRSRVYPEWDAHRRRYHADWCTVNEVDVPLVETEPAVASDRYGLRRPLARLGMGLDHHHRQTQGDDLDIDAAIEARLETLAGSAPDEAVYVDSLRRRRDLGVLVLLDISGSAGEPTTTGETVHEQQRAVAAALTAALHEIGDRVALYAFQSQGRSSVSVLPVKRFDGALDARAMQRLQSLVPGGYSRLGAAIRHGTVVLEERAGTPRRLLVVLSDGLAYDHGYEPDYGAADSRRALAEARHRGVGCLCLSIGASTETEALRRVFGSAAHATVPIPSQLGTTIGPLFRSAIHSADVRRRVA